jgi:hypothetical protein
MWGFHHVVIAITDTMMVPLWLPVIAIDGNFDLPLSDRSEMC